jgi:hypothetical protein
MRRVVTSVLQNEPMIDPVLSKAIHVPRDPPQIQYQQSNASEHRKNVVHGVHFMLIIVKLHQVKDQQQNQRKKSDTPKSDVQPHQEMILVRFCFFGDGRVSLQFLCLLDVAARNDIFEQVLNR